MNGKVDKASPIDALLEDATGVTRRRFAGFVAWLLLVDGGKGVTVAEEFGIRDSG